MQKPKLIVMLTQNDHTVSNARAIFAACKDSEAQYWGAKENGIPPEELKALYADFRACGKTGFMEVVAYTEAQCLDAARLAAQCGCDGLLGTVYFPSVHQICLENHMQYLPFVGKVSGRPSVLEGTDREILCQIRELTEKGIGGVDLLGYRHQAGYELSKAVIAEAECAVCLAGSIDGYERLDQVLEMNPAWFTIGGAFFDGKFGGDFGTQIHKVLAYMAK